MGLFLRKQGSRDAYFSTFRLAIRSARFEISCGIGPKPNWHRTVFVPQG